ncbi:unnamed protein product [Aphanomyces euteiches]
MSLRQIRASVEGPDSMADSPRSAHTDSRRSSGTSGLSENPDEFVARFQTTKLSWKGKYERIFALSATRFCTIDPKDFDVTNSWSFQSFISLELDPNDDNVFTLTIQGPKKEEQLKLRHKYRAYLLTEFLRLHAANMALSMSSRGSTPLQCNATKYTRHGNERNCILEVAPDGLVYKEFLPGTAQASVMARFSYPDVEHLTTVSNSTSGFVVGCRGKQTIFFTVNRTLLLGSVEKAAARIGLRIATRGTLTLEQVEEDKPIFEEADCIVQFAVQKFSKRNEKPVRRVLALIPGNLVELDVKSATGATPVVASFPLKSIFDVVRHPGTSQFELEFINGTKRMYACPDRDGVLAALFDAVMTADRDVSFLEICSTPSQTGLRLLPRFAVEDVSESTSFFGDSSIGATFLKRLAAVGKYTSGTGIRAGAAAGRGLVDIASEFNANVPISGVQYHTKRSIVLDALKPLAVQLHNVATCQPPAPRMAVILLQCICRIAASFYGYRELLHLPQVVDSVLHFLQADDELTVFWAALLLQRLTMPTTSSSTSSMLDNSDDPAVERRSTNIEAETINKRLVFGNEKFVTALISGLGKFAQNRAGPLSLMGNLKVLEGALYSHRHSTDATAVHMIVEKLVPHFDSLIKLLFQSRCAMTVESCTHLVQTVLRLCAPNEAASIKDAALRQGLVLQHLYQAIFDPSFDQRCVSRYMITMWMSDHAPAKQLLRRIFPPGLVSCLDMRMLSPAEVYQLDELEKTTFMDKFGEFNAELLTSRRILSEISFTDRDSFSDALESSISSSKLLDRVQIKTKGDVFDEGFNSSRRLRRPSSPARQSVKGGFFNLQMLRRAINLGRDAPTTTQTVDHGPSEENFRILFHMVQQDHETIDLVWTTTTREELRNALVHEIHELREANAAHSAVVWNYEDFSVTYQSLEAEFVVDGLYLRHLLSCQVAPIDVTNLEDSFRRPVHKEEIMIKKPKRFVNALYKKLLREHGDAEFRGNMEWSITCLRAIAYVAWMYEDEYTLPTEDLAHLLLMLRETTRRNLLVHLLHALRSITKVPAHGTKVLREQNAVTLLVELIQMAHTSQRKKTAQIPTWSHGGETLVTVDGLRQYLVESGQPTSAIQVNGVPLSTYPQLKWELCMDESFNSVAVAHNAVQILIALLKSNPLVSPDAAVYPIPLGRQYATAKFAEIASLLMVYELPKLNELIMHVLVHLSLDSEQLYMTGVFYMLFLYKGTAFADFARFLKLTHKTQTTIFGTVRHVLSDLLPRALIVQLDKLPRDEFAAIFCGDTESDRVIWNKKMRQHLWECCFNHMSDYRSVLQQDVSRPFDFHPMAPVIYEDLANEVFCHGYYLGQYCDAMEDIIVADSGIFLDTLAFEWSKEANRKASTLSHDEAMQILQIQDGDDIRQAYKLLCQDICPEKAQGDPTKLQRYEDIQVACTVMTSPRESLLTDGYDAINLSLILRTQLKLFKRHAEDLTVYSFEAYPLLLNLLHSHCTYEQNVPALTSHEEQMNLSILAAELLYASCSVAPQNYQLLLQEERVGVIQDVLRYCVENMINNEDEREMFTTLTSYIIQTIAGLATSSGGRSWITQSKDVLPKCWHILWYYHNKAVPSEPLFVVVRHTLDALASMCELPELQGRIATSGIVWHLFYMWFAYDIDVNEADVTTSLKQTVLFGNHNASICDFAAETKNFLATLAVDAICAASANLAMQTICNSILTPNLFFQSTNPSRHKFLNLFHRDTRSHRLIWTAAMRSELNEFLVPFVKIDDPFPSVENALAFRYSALKEECIVEEVYIAPLFASLNSTPQPTDMIDFVRQLGLSARFYASLVEFIRNGQLNSTSVVGWGLTTELIVYFRETAIGVLARVASAASTQVEACILGDDSGLATLFSFVLSPGHKAMSTRPNVVQLVPIDVFGAFQKYALAVLVALAKSKTFADALYRADYFPLLMHAALLEDENSSAVLEIVGSLCGSCTTIAQYMASSIWFYHVLLWTFHISDMSSITDDSNNFGQTMQIPAAKIISILGGPSSLVLEETMNVMVRLIPVALIYEITTAPQNVATILQSHYEAPDLVWNETLRSHCYREMLHLSILVNQCTDSGVVSDELKEFEIDFAKVYPYPMIGDVYLLLYLENPIHPLRDPKFFLECLLEDFETISQALVTSLSQRSSFSPDLIMAVRQQTQLLPIITSCIICAIRVYPSHLDDIAAWKYTDKLGTLFVLLQNHFAEHKGIREEEAVAVEINLLRVFRVLFVSPRIVASLAYSPFNILSRLISHCRVNNNRDYHTELAFILEIIRRFLLSFPDDGDKNSNKNVVAIVCGLNYIEFLLEMIEHPQTLQHVANPSLACATIIATLNRLEQHRTQASLAHHILKKHKKWDKVYRHEPTDEVRKQPEDKFLVGPAAGADAMIRNFMASKATSSTSSAPPSVVHSSRKLPATQKLKNFFR